jgi:hypothetical protein
MTTMLTRLQTWTTDGMTFLGGAVSRIFGLTDDQYPATGVQPYSGDPSHEH